MGHLDTILDTMDTALAPPTERRPYQASHPWLTFRLDLREAPPHIWLLLGECASKVDHLAGVPLRPDTAHYLMRVYLARGVLASAAIEGNTLTEEEALAHVEGKLTTPPSRKYLQKEIDNILRLHNEVAQEIVKGKPRPLTTAVIKDYNRRILEGLEVDAHVVPGEIPTVDIGVGRYRGAPRPDCEFLLDRLTEWLNKDWIAPGLIDRVGEAIIKAVMAHLYLAWIHPFGDGNGRTARMVEAQILMQGCLPQPACQLLSNHYNRTRDRYYRELQRASASGGDVLPFLIYAVEGFRDGLKEQIDVVRAQQWDVSWRNYVHEQFKDGGDAMKRRRNLVLDLGRHKSMPRSKVAEVSPRVAATYAKLDDKTLTRDLVWLEANDLVRKEGDDYVANREVILAFLPRAAPLRNGKADE
jgi:Fic family protein